MTDWDLIGTWYNTPTDLAHPDSALFSSPISCLWYLGDNFFYWALGGSKCFLTDLFDRNNWHGTRPNEYFLHHGDKLFVLILETLITVAANLFFIHSNQCDQSEAGGNTVWLLLTTWKFKLFVPLCIQGIWQRWLQCERGSITTFVCVQKRSVLSSLKIAWFKPVKLCVSLFHMN